MRRLFNSSLCSSHVPQSFKSAYITPLLKKAGLDKTDVKSYRPISNLSVVSNMLERVILSRLLEHLKANGLFPNVQSAYRKCHSTETAMARVLSDILMALDRGDVAALALLPYWTCLLRSTQNEFIWCAPARRRHHIPNGDVQVGHGSVHPVQRARDLGVYVDGGMTMRTHINHVL